MSSGKAPPEPIYTLRGVGNTVTALQFLSDEALYSGDSNGTVHIWNMKTHRVSSTLKAHPGHSVLWLDFTQTGTFLTQGRDGLVKVWSQSEPGYLETGSMKSSSMGFCGASLSEEQKIVAVPSESQSQIDLYDLRTHKLTSKLVPNPDDRSLGMCMKIKISQTSDMAAIFVGFEDGSIALWDFRINKMADRFKVHEESVMCMDFSSEMEKGFSGSPDDKLISWTTESNKLKINNTIVVKNPGFNDIVIRRDGKIVVTAGWDKQIRIFGCKKLKPLAILSYHKDSINCLAFSPDNLLACGSKDQHISLWDIYR